MLRFSAVLIAVVAVQMVSAQGPPGPPPPPQCRGPPPGVDKPHECCKIPPFFTEEDLKECGFEKMGGEGPRGPPPQGPPQGPPDCTKQTCILKKYSLTSEDETVDKDALINFMSDYAESHPEFASAIEVAKERCVGKEIPGPPHICEANKLVFCVTHTMFEECPKWEERDGCDVLKKQMEECKPFFPH